MTGGNTRTLAAAAGGLAILGGLLATWWWWWRSRPEQPQPQPQSHETEPAAAPPDAAPMPIALWGAAVIVGGHAVSGNYGLLHGCALVLLGGLLWQELKRDQPGGAAPEQQNSARHDRALWLIAAAGGLLAVVAHRFDIDDAFYVGVAVTTADLPDRILLASDPVHQLASQPLQSPVYRLHSFELLGGLLSYLSSIPAVWIMHVGMTAVAGVMVPLCHGRLLEQLMPRRMLWALAGTLALLLLDGGVHRSFGNFSFVRLFQGKAVFYAAILPLIMAYGIEFARAPGWRAFLMLSSAQIAAIGLTSSALPLAPLAAAGGLLTGLRGPRALRTLTWGCAASFYVVTAGAVLYVRLKGGEASASAIEQASNALGSGVRDIALSSIAQDALGKVLGDGVHLHGYLLLALIAPAIAPPGRARRFCLVFSLLHLLFGGNPLLAEVLAKHFFGEVTQWRSLWLWPLPIMAGMTMAVLARPHRETERPVHPWRRPLLVSAGLLAYAIAGPGMTTLAPKNSTIIGLPQPKLGPHAEVARSLAHAVPAGARVVAPAEIAAVLPMLHHAARPVFVKRSYLKMPKAAIDERHRLANCAAGHRAHCAGPWFGRALDRLRVEAFCLFTGSAVHLKVRRQLQRAGFTRRRSLRSFEIWTRRISPIGATRSGGGAAVGDSP